MTSRTRTRRAAAHRIARATGWLTVSSLVATAALAPAVHAAKPVANSTPVVGPLAHGAGIAIDGIRSDWTAADRYADMFRAAKPDKPVESTLFLRYDCETGTLAAMVETVDGVVLDAEGDHFIKVDGVKRVGSPSIGDFTMSADGRGWEASFGIDEGTYSLNVHAQVLDGGSQTSAVQDRDVPLTIDCPQASSTQELPSQAPSQDPTQAPSETPTEEPSETPTEQPSEAPSGEPSEAPTQEPSDAPSEQPSEAPSEEPSEAPTEQPSQAPTEQPSEAPTDEPSREPSQAPSEQPSEVPTQEPSQAPTEQPTETPSEQPSATPSEQPTSEPTSTPTGTTAPTGGVEGATGTPQLTPPPTDVAAAPVAPASDGWRLAILGLAGLIAAALLIGTPRERARRR